jgi:hypothetical protein
MICFSINRIPFTNSEDATIKRCPVCHVPIERNGSGGVYSIQHHVIKFVSDFVTGWWFSLGTLVSSINKTDSHDIAEILLKVALNTITLTLP